MAMPNMVPIHGRPDGQQRQGPSTSSASDPGTQGDHSAAIRALYDSQVSRESGHQGVIRQGLSIPVGGFGTHGRISQSMARLGNTLQLLGATDHRDSTPQRQAPTLTGSRACAEIDQQLVRLRLLNSSNTCYINATVLAWLHAIQRLSCNDRQAYGSKTQAWRDVSLCRRAVRVHTLASWRGILAGWRDLRRQQDASEFLEHWVAVGRPQAVTGTWEARVENQQLIEIRHHSSTDVALSLDLERSRDSQSLQHLIFSWHTQNLGIQALKNPPLILMIRLSRFQRLFNSASKVTTPVIIEPRVNIPVFDDDALHCTNTPYDVVSVILRDLRAGHSPHAGHYTARLLTEPAGSISTAPWSTDDARPAMLIARDIRQDHNLSQQAYILLLGRGTAAHRQ